MYSEEGAEKLDSIFLIVFLEKQLWLGIYITNFNYLSSLYSSI
jgi:hypothetical protein